MKKILSLVLLCSQFVFTSQHTSFNAQESKSKVFPVKQLQYPERTVNADGTITLRYPNQTTIYCPDKSYLTLFTNNVHKEFEDDEIENINYSSR